MIYRENKIYGEQSIPTIAFSVVSFSKHIADFVMPGTQQPIVVIILIIYSSYFLKDLVEL